jgi:cytochrome c peroxidase
MRMTPGVLLGLSLSIGLTAGITVSARQQGRPGGPPPGPPFPGPPGRGRGGDVRPMAVPEANPLTPEKITRGRALFFDTRLSADRTVSCATCHQPDRGFTDGQAVARGVHGTMGTRNTPTLVEAGYGRAFFWDGRAESLEAQVLMPITNPAEMGLDLPTLEARVGLPGAEVAAALASYVRTIRSRESRYDWFQAGQVQMLTAEERAGLEVFRGRGQCGACHGGPDLTDGGFHNTGVGWADGQLSDEGRFAVTGDDRDHGAFKTPTLRDVALTEPYMHDGSLATLDDVVEFYSAGGRPNPHLDPRLRPRHFAPDEKRALVAFLRALTGRVSEGLAGDPGRSR